MKAKAVAVYIALCLFGVVSLLGDYYAFVPNSLFHTETVEGTVVLVGQRDFNTPHDLLVCVFPNYIPSQNNTYYKQISAWCDRGLLHIPEKFNLTWQTVFLEMVRATYIRENLEVTNLEFAV